MILDFVESILRDNLASVRRDRATLLVSDPASVYPEIGTHPFEDPDYWEALDALEDGIEGLINDLQEVKPFFDPAYPDPYKAAVRHALAESSRNSCRFNVFKVTQCDLTHVEYWSAPASVGTPPRVKGVTIQKIASFYLYEQ